MKEYRTEIKTLQERVDELIKKNEKMDKEIINLLEQKDELMKKNAEKDEQMGEMMELIEGLKKEITALKNEIAILKKNNNSKYLCLNNY